MKKTQLKQLIKEIAKKSLLLENNLSPKNNSLIEKWIKEKGGVRGAAIRIIDSILSQKTGLVSADYLPDTSTFANGLDEMEDLLSSGDYKGALQIAIETAREMIEDEGGTGIFEGKIKENNEVDDDAFYVEYLREIPNENPFMLGGEKFQYVMAKYPSGKKDIAVYAFRGDVVYGYKTFRERYNLH